MEAKGINSRTAGNVSARVDGGMLITPSGLAYDRMTIGQIIRLNADHSWAPLVEQRTEQLSLNVLKALERRRACLMAHHGILAIGADLAAALALTVEVEVLAGQYLAALAIGEPPELTAEQMDEVLVKMASSQGYGSSPPPDPVGSVD